MEELKQHSFSFDGSDLSFSSEYIVPALLPVDEGPYIVTSLALDVSGRCNLRCVYCAERSTQPSRTSMTERVLQRAIDALFAWSSPDIPVSVHLGSGEPLLEPALVRKVGVVMRRHAERRNRSYALFLTTNATLMDKKIMRQLIADNWEIKISLDGDADVHDRFRVTNQGTGTFAEVSRVTQELSRLIPERVSTTSVVCHNTDFLEVFNTLAGFRVKHFELIPVALPASSPLQLDSEDISRYREFLSTYARRLAGGERLPFLKALMKRVHRVMGFRNSRIPCGAGRNFMGVDSEGSLFPCFRFLGVKEYLLGHIEQGPDPQKVKDFFSHGGRSYDRRASCKDCWAAALCGGPCFAVTELLGYQDSSSLPGYCAMVQTESEAAIWLVEYLRESNPQRLLDFLHLKTEE